MIKDFKGRLYTLIGIDGNHTVMECLATGDIVRVANNQYKACGF